MNMESTNHPFASLLLALALLLCFAACIESITPSDGTDQNQRANDGDNTWCIAKPSTDNLKLRNNIDYSCGQNEVDCGPIQAGGSCFHPNNAISHASYAMNLFYKSAGKNSWNCHFNGTGLIVSQNPSVGNCNYPL